MQIIEANFKHLEILVPLFDAYRIFYHQPSDLKRAENFLRERLTQKNAIILLAMTDQGSGAGFLQIYPAFSSIRTARIYLLNDLYVAPTYRQQSLGRALMNATKDLALKNDIAKITLSTANTNMPAQKLYESLGYQKDQTFLYYDLVLLNENNQKC